MYTNDAEYPLEWEDTIDGWIRDPWWRSEIDGRVLGRLEGPGKIVGRYQPAGAVYCTTCGRRLPDGVTSWDHETGCSVQRA